MFRRLILCAVTCSFVIPVFSAGTMPHWIRPLDGKQLSHTFTAPNDLSKAQLLCVADFCDVDIAINGTVIASLPAYSALQKIDISSQLKPGKNVLRLSVTEHAGPSALALRIGMSDGKRTTEIVSSPSWKGASGRGVLNDRYWGFNNDRVAVSVFDDYEQWRRARAAPKSTAASTFQLLPGYQIELVRSAAKDEDSWIAMDFDPRGRLVIAREKQGLLRLSLQSGKIARVEVINEDLAEIRGVLFAHDALYVNSNSHNLRTSPRDRTGGLYRLRDSTGDDQYDEVKLLGERTQTGGHGRNDLTLGPDGKIYMIAGDSVALPKQLVDFTPPIPHQLPGDDLDHGHVIRTDKDGKQWELVCEGLRNPYGIDFNPDGEMFTFDADAEFDMGAPWYRPTRVRQLVRGADYGWRRVTDRWPPYYPDHADEPPNTLDIGKSSPTSVKFGTKSHFPKPYQKALFILDWTYGRIMAIHMTPRGAGYQCRTEEFLRGRPANVTDLAFGPDGAMYFVTGGRGTQSGLYRVSYTGPKRKPVEPSPQERAREIFGRRNRSDRDRICENEQMALDYLGDDDPWLRYIARTRLEQAKKVDLNRLTKSSNAIDADLAYLTAVARRAADPYVGAIPSRLNRIQWDQLNERQKLELIRVHEICRIRLAGRPVMEEGKTRRQLAAAFPDKSDKVNWVLCALLASMREPSLPGKTIPLLRAAKTPTQEIHYLFQLRDLTEGWTAALRQAYFSSLRQTTDIRGGRGLPKFLARIRRDALAAIPAPERVKYAAIAEQQDNLNELIKTVPTNRRFVREWKLSDFTDSSNPKPNLTRGEQMYTAASCILCHQLGGAGRVFGPDLTTAAGRYTRRDLLDAIIHPSKVVAEKYRSVTITTKDGAEHTGRLDFTGDYRKSKIRLYPNPLRPDQFIEIDKVNIAAKRFSELSAMPEGLLNSLTKEEILDLLAYIETGGL